MLTVKFLICATNILTNHVMNYFWWTIWHCSLMFLGIVCFLLAVSITFHCFVHTYMKKEFRSLHIPQMSNASSESLILWCSILKVNYDCRFLISFAGKYLANDFCNTSLHGLCKGSSVMFGHQLYRISVPPTEPNLFGPAFVEVSK